MGLVPQSGAVAEHSASPELELWGLNLWVCLVWGGGGHPEVMGAAGPGWLQLMGLYPWAGSALGGLGLLLLAQELTGLGSHRSLEVLQGEVPKIPQTGWSCQQGDSWLWQWGALGGEGLVGPQQHPGRAGEGWVMAKLLFEGYRWEVSALWELQPAWESRDIVISFEF